MITDDWVEMLKRLGSGVEGKAVAMRLNTHFRGGRNLAGGHAKEKRRRRESDSCAAPAMKETFCLIAHGGQAQRSKGRNRLR